MSFGEKLAKMRKEKGYSQEELANLLNVSRQAVSKWESNNSYPETEKIVAICKLFECSMDELIGLKEGNVKKENDFFKNINNYFEYIIKGMKLFYSMTFSQKVKCVIELTFYTLALVVFAAIINQVIILAISQLLNILPGEILYHVVETIQGILQLVYMVIIIYLVVKLYKVRYLDYYQVPEVEVVHEEQKEVTKEKVKINEEKIIIRDSNDDFKPFSFIKNIFLLFVKFVSFFITFGLLIAFVVLVACTIFTIYFANHGLLIIYTAFGLIGACLLLYIVIEVLIKFIFNITQKFKKLFVMFILSLIILGISGGLFFCEFSTYTIKSNVVVDTKVKEVNLAMEDNLIIEFLNDYNNEVIYEDRNDIVIEFYATNEKLVDVKDHKYKERYRFNNTVMEFDVQSYYINYLYDGKSIKDATDEILGYIKKKEIIINSPHIKTKVYISSENYDKLIDNMNVRNLSYNY